MQSILLVTELPNGGATQKDLSLKGEKRMILVGAGGI